MSMEVIPGSGRDGEEPSSPVPGDGFCGEGEDAWLRRVMAEADDDEAWIPEERVEAALAGLPVRLVHNPDFADGLGGSVKAGIAAVPASVDGAVICLGDMPQVDAALIDRLIAAFAPERGALAAVPTIDGKRGNPVLWSRRFFPELMAIEGDVGARNLIARYGEAVIEVPVSGKGAFTDVDTQETLAGLRAEVERG